MLHHRTPHDLFLCADGFSIAHAEAAGTSLSESPRELLSWCLNAERDGQFQGGKPKHIGGMTVGNYTYMDSGLCYACPVVCV